MKSTARKSTSQCNGTGSPSDANNGKMKGPNDFNPVVIEDDEDDCVLLDAAVAQKVQPYNTKIIPNGNRNKLLENLNTSNGLVKKRQCDANDISIKKAKLEAQHNKSSQATRISKAEIIEMLESQLSEKIVKHPEVAQIKQDLEQLKISREIWKNQIERFLIKQRELLDNKKKIVNINSDTPQSSNIYATNQLQKVSTKVSTIITPSQNKNTFPNKSPNKNIADKNIKNVLLSTNKELKTNDKGNVITNGNVPNSLVAKENINSVIDLTLDNCSSSSVINKQPPLLPPLEPQFQPKDAKDLPPKPTVQIQTIDQGIVLTWGVSGDTKNCEEAKIFEIHSYQHHSQNVQHKGWIKIGKLDALPLPMACTLKSIKNNHYFFSIRSVDKYHRYGAFSDPVSTLSS